MARLFDRLLIHGAYDGSSKRRVPPTIAHAEDEPMVFDIQNVVDFSLRHMVAPDKPWKSTSYPNVAPPFPRFWMEFALKPEHVAGPPSSELPRHVGLLFHGFDLEAAYRRGRDVGLSIDPMARTVRRIMAGGAVEPQSAGAEPFAPDDVARRRERLWNWAMGQDPLRPMSADERRRMALYLLPYLHLRWDLTCDLFLEYTKGDIRYEAAYQCFVQPDGTMYAWGQDDHTVFTYTVDVDQATLDANPEVEQWFGQLFNYLVIPAYVAIAFLHCKNVERPRVAPPAKVARAAKRKHDREPVRFHVLKIQQIQEVLANEGKIEEHGLERAIHICRGHFVTYDAKPAFGKVRGTFWREAHVRGSIKQGIVDKEYRLARPKQTTNPEQDVADVPEEGPTC